MGTLTLNLLIKQNGTMIYSASRLTKLEYWSPNRSLRWHQNSMQIFSVCNICIFSLGGNEHLMTTMKIFIGAKTLLGGMKTFYHSKNIFLKGIECSTHSHARCFVFSNHSHVLSNVPIWSMRSYGNLNLCITWQVLPIYCSCISFLILCICWSNIW